MCPDHIHLLLSIAPKMSISGFIGYLKGKSSLMIFQRFGDMKFAYRNREFWCKGYYVDTVGKNTKAIKEYIENQLKADRESDQISLYDPRDPFTGRRIILCVAGRPIKNALCVLPVILGLCPKRKYPPLCGGIFIAF